MEDSGGRQECGRGKVFKNRFLIDADIGNPFLLSPVECGDVLEEIVEKSSKSTLDSLKVANLDI